MSEDDRRAGEGAGRRWWIWLVAVVPFLSVALVQWRSAPPGDITDTYQYQLHARALAEGRGYTDTGYLFTDYAPWVGPVARPPGLPLTLLPVVALAGASMLLMQLVVFATTLGYLVVAGRYFARMDSWPLGVGVALLAGLVPRFPGLSMQLLNDLPFCFIFWLTLWVMDREGPFDWRRIALVTALTGAAVAYRLAGVALIPAMGLYGLIRFRDRGWAPLVPPAILGGAGLLALVITDVGIPTWVVAIEWHPLALASKVGQQVMGYRLGVIESLLYPWPWDLANDLYHVVAALLVLLGLGDWVRRGWRTFAFSAALGYGAMLVVLPATQGRYLWPLVPFVMYGLLRGTVLVVTRWPGPGRVVPARAALVLAGLLAVSTAVTHWRHPPPEPLASAPDVREVLSWVEELSVETPRVAFFKPRLLAWYTRVPAMALPLIPDTASTRAVIEEFRRQGITHVIAHRPEVNRLDASAVHRAVREHPDQFAEHRRNATFVAYRFVHRGAP